MGKNNPLDPAEQESRASLTGDCALPLAVPTGADNDAKAQAVTLRTFAGSNIGDRNPYAPLSARALGQFIDATNKKVDALHDNTREAAVDSWTVTPGTIPGEAYGYDAALTDGSIGNTGAIAPDNALTIGASSWRLVRVTQNIAEHWVQLKLAAPLQPFEWEQLNIADPFTSARTYLKELDPDTPWRVPTQVADDVDLIFHLPGMTADGVKVNTSVLRALPATSAGEQYDHTANSTHSLGTFGGIQYHVGRTQRNQLLLAQGTNVGADLNAAGVRVVFSSLTRTQWRRLGFIGVNRQGASVVNSLRAISFLAHRLATGIGSQYSVPATADDDETLHFPFGGGMEVNTSVLRALVAAPHGTDASTAPVNQRHVLGVAGGITYYLARQNNTARTLMWAFSTQGPTTSGYVYAKKVTTGGERTGTPADIPPHTDFDLGGTVLHVRDANYAKAALTRDPDGNLLNEGILDLVWQNEAAGIITAAGDVTLELLGATAALTAAAVSVDATNFGTNLTANATTVQEALDEIDNFSIGGSPNSGQTAHQVRAIIAAEVPASARVPGGGNLTSVLKRVSGTNGGAWAEQQASDVTVDASAFGTNLAATDTTMQKVANKVNSMSLGRTEAQVNAQVRAGVSDWAETGNASQIPANKLQNAPSGTGGLTQAQVDARIATWGRVGNKDEIPVAKMPDDLQLIDRNITNGGWRAEPKLQVSPYQAAAYTLATARAANYSVSLGDQGTAQNGRNIVVRVARTLFHARPSDSEESRLRLRVDSDGALVRPLDGGTYLGDDANGDYDYYNVNVTPFPAEALAVPEFDAPTELNNVAIPAGSVVGLLTGSGAGVIGVMDGTLTPPAVTNFGADHQTNAASFAPVFDLDDHPNGLFECILRAGVATSSDTLSFANDKTLTTGRASGFVSASDLRGQAEFTRAGAVEGIQAARLPVYAVSNNVYTEIGALTLYLVRTATNECQYVFDYVHNPVHSETGNASFSCHLFVAFQKQDSGSGAAQGSVLTRESLAAAVNLADPTANGIVDSAWDDVFSHTVTAAEAGRGFMHIGATVFATVNSGSDQGGDRPILVVQLIKGAEELARNYRYFRFSGGIPLDCILSETVAVAAGDVLKVRAQMSRLVAAGTTLGASVTTDSHWERFSTT